MGDFIMDYSFFKQVGNNIENVLYEKNYTQQDLANELKISKQVMITKHLFMKLMKK